MGANHGLVPITRDYLSRFYDKYPFPPLSDDVHGLTLELRSMSNELLRELPPMSESERLLVLETECQPPHKMDENMWKNREHVEEIVFLLDKAHWPQQLQEGIISGQTEFEEIAAILVNLNTKLSKLLKELESFQGRNADRIFNIVMSYMPQDFRGTLIRQQKERSERNKQAEIDALISSGGSIQDRYALMWRQQMDRRRMLVQLGSSNGVYKTIVKYLAGVPQVLLDFIKQINDDEGPMEEQRQRYGPSMYSLTSMVLSIRLFLHLCWARFEARELDKPKLDILVRAIDVYTSELERFLELLSLVFANSPFFISAEDAGAEKARKMDEYNEVIVPAGKMHEVLLTVADMNSYIAWDFSLIPGRMASDIGFHVEYISPSGEATPILPFGRYGSNQGNFSACMTGIYKLIWDNSYSTFTKKGVRYRIDCIPPAVPNSESGKS